jgi:hypothetical protein
MSETIKIRPEYLDKMAEALSKYPQQKPSSWAVDNRVHKNEFLIEDDHGEEYDLDQDEEVDVELTFYEIGVLVATLDDISWTPRLSEFAVDPIMRKLMGILNVRGVTMPHIEWVDPLTIVADKEETEEDTCEECGVVLEEDRASQDLCDSCESELNEEEEDDE